MLAAVVVVVITLVLTEDTNGVGVVADTVAVVVHTKRKMMESYSNHSVCVCVFFCYDVEEQQWTSPTPFSGTEPLNQCGPDQHTHHPDPAHPHPVPTLCIRSLSCYLSYGSHTLSHAMYMYIKLKCHNIKIQVTSSTIGIWTVWP